MAESDRQEKKQWQGKHYSFFQNRKCEYFPCHKGADTDSFNCLFCYCPLYPLGADCGGNPVYNEKGIKDCSHCLLPHRRDNYGYVTGQFGRLAQAMEMLRSVRAQDE